MPDGAQPLFTVAIPCYNRADLVGRTIESVYAQTFTDYEIVCVNDGSTDGTLGVLRSHEPRVRVVDQPNAGLAGARNTGADHARGRYVIFLDSDDLFFPWSLRVLADAVERGVEASPLQGPDAQPAMVSGEFTPFGDEAELDRFSDEPSRLRVFDDYLSTRARSTGVAPSATAVRTDLYNSSGRSDPVRVMFEDVDIWFKVGAHPGYVHADGPPVAGYRVGHAQMMGNMKKQLDGFRWIAGKVAKGEYQSLPARRGQMEDALALHAQGCAFRCIHMRDRGSGWSFYSRSLPWQIRAKNLKFAALYPALLLAGWAPTSPSMRRQKKQVVSDEQAATA